MKYLMPQDSNDNSYSRFSGKVPVDYSVSVGTDADVANAPWLRVMLMVSWVKGLLKLFSQAETVRGKVAVAPKCRFWRIVVH